MKKSRLAIIALVVIALPFLWYKWSLRPVDASAALRVPVEIPIGSSLKKIASILEEKEVIRSSSAFLLYSKFHGRGGKSQAGTFVMTTDMGPKEILDALEGGMTGETIVTIPEGFTVKDIDALLAEKGLTQKGDIEQCARSCDFSAFNFLPTGVVLADRGGKVEGYLYPDTYFVLSEGFTAKAFLDRLLSTFEKKVVTGMRDDLKKSDRSLHQIVTMASLIEEETRKANERPMVSGILWKRFDGGTGLGVDAAVRYILNKPTADITKTDLDVDSDYNLRKYRGLPPGPIASPSISSIEAALKPKESPYLYYLHGTDGQIRYAETNEEHNVNRAKYL